MDEDSKLRNIYNTKSNEEFSTAWLDRESIPIGHYLIKRCLAKENMFGYTMDDVPSANEVMGPKLLVQKAVSSKGTTIKRTAIKLEKAKKSEEHIDQEKRTKKGEREKKEIDRINSKMNACQAVVSDKCAKLQVKKGDGIKAAFKALIGDAYRRLHDLPHTDRCEDVGHLFQSENILIEYMDVSQLPCILKQSVAVVTYEFAGMKFKGDHSSGKEYICHIEKEIKRSMSNFPNTHHIAISEEKYTFTPDLFKSQTHQQRSKKVSLSTNHLKTREEMISDTKFDKVALTTTSEGKCAVSTYIASNVSSIHTRRTVTLDIDSDLYMLKCACCLQNCTCKLLLRVNAGYISQWQEKNDSVFATCIGC